MNLLEGLRLERRGILLPWLVMPRELRSLGDPEIHDERRQKRGVTYAWRYEECLGGIACTVSARIFGGNPLRTLVISPSGAPRETFTRCVAKLQAALGDPVVVSGYDGTPRASWSHPSLEVSCDVIERFGEYLEVTIRRKG